MCIKNQDVGRMLKGIRQIENDDMAAMETHQLAEVMAIFKALSDDYEKIENVLRAELAERIGGEVVMFPELQRKVQMKEGRKIRTVDTIGVYTAMKEFDLLDYVPEIMEVKLGKADAHYCSEVIEVVANNTEETQGAPYVAVTKMAKADY